MQVPAGFLPRSETFTNGRHSVLDRPLRQKRFAAEDIRIQQKGQALFDRKRLDFVRVA